MQRLYATFSNQDEKPFIGRVSIVILLWWVGLFFTFFNPCPLQGAELPDLGNSASAILTPAQEYELGRNVMKQLQSASVLYDDIIVNDYLQNLGYQLIATHLQGQNAVRPSFHFFAVEDKSINAFALPGGFVGVNTGLLLATEGESELAGVLSHEIAHVQQKHIARMYEHMGRLRLSTIAGMIASILIATQNSQAASGAMAATLASSQQALINFTRDHEKEADSVGIHAMTQAGFDPMGMPAFFHRMYQDTRYYGNHLPEYLLTHPLTESRLMAAQSRAKSYPYRQVPDSLQYHLIQARVLVQSFATANDAALYFAKKIERGNYRSQVGTLYGYVLALIDKDNPLAAKPYLNELLAISPDQPLFQLAYAQMEMNALQLDDALMRLHQALKDHPHHYALTFAYCEGLIKHQESQKAISLLQAQIRRKPVRPMLWHLLSAAHASANQPIQAHLAQAQYLKLLGDYNNALIQLRLANKRVTITPQEKRQIESEIKEIQEKLNT